MRHLFIINPTAGIVNKKNKSTKVYELENKIKSYFLEIADEYDIAVTSKPLEAVEIVERYSKKYKNEQIRIYACGGDGTLNEVVNGAYKHPNCAVGAIPIGSGNDFVRAYEPLVRADFLSLDRMVNGDIDAVDLLTVSEDGKEPRASINIVSVGFDAETANRMKKYKKIPMVNGSLAYNLSLVETLFTSLKHSLEFEVDGRRIEGGKKNFLLAIAANGRWYGGGFKAAPIAELSDGLLDFIRVPSLPIYKIANLVSVFRKGEHLDKLKFVEFVRCRKLKIISDNPINVNLDGEIFSMKDPVITLLPKAMRIIVPKPIK